MRHLPTVLRIGLVGGASAFALWAGSPAAKTAPPDLRVLKIENAVLERQTHFAVRPGASLEEASSVLKATWLAQAEAASRTSPAVVLGNRYGQLFKQGAPQGLGFATLILKDGRVLVSGGVGLDLETLQSASRIYDPAQAVWEPLGGLVWPRFGHRMILDAQGRVVLTGGTDLQGTPLVGEILDLTSGRWVPTTDPGLHP